MNKKIGFIGGGNMCGAIMGGIIRAELVSPENIIVSDLFESSLSKLKELYGINVTKNNQEVAGSVDVLFLSVKPFALSGVLEEIKEKIKKDTVIVSIVAGQTISSLEERIGKEYKIIRVMPNTPALVGAGMSALSLNDVISDKKYEQEVNEIVTLFNSFGLAEIVPEHLMDAVTGVGGSAPAYIFMIIEAMADGAVMEGMPRDKAYKFAAQTVLGSAKMVLETGKHPGELKDMVTSPAGTTIEGVYALEKSGIRSAMMESIHVAAEKSRSL